MGPSPVGWKIEFSMSGTTLLSLRNSLEMQTEISRVFQLDPQIGRLQKKVCQGEATKINFKEPDPWSIFKLIDRMLVSFYDLSSYPKRLLCN